MNKMNFMEIMEVLQNIYPDVNDFAYDDMDSIKVPEDFNPIEGGGDWKSRRARANEYMKSKLGEYEKVDSYGGEGEGERWWVVYHFVDHGVYIRVDGYYQSYDGVSFYDGWSCCKEVKPVEKKITVYE